MDDQKRPVIGQREEIVNDEPSCTCSINSAGGIHYYDPDCPVHFPPRQLT